MPLCPEYPEIGNPLGVAALADGPLTGCLPGSGALLILAGLMAGAGSLLLRFRRARGLERLCSCAGWPGGRCWRRWRCWSP